MIDRTSTLLSLSSTADADLDYYYRGFDGAWVHNPTRFTNTYYKLMESLSWQPKTLDNGVKQFTYYDEDLDTELMMLPTDLALLSDPSFKPWVHKYAEDKDKFFEDFAKVFAKLIDLGIQRDEDGKITNCDNEKGGYLSAPKKKGKAGKKGQAGKEADPLAKENQQFRAKL